MKPLVLLLSVMILTACSMTLPVKGQLQDSSETFEGTATGYLDGSGDLYITTNEGAVCEGNFVYVSSRRGEGVFVCEDGRNGPFEFVSTGSKGTGHGSLGGKDLTFTFGD